MKVGDRVVFVCERGEIRDISAGDKGKVHCVGREMSSFLFGLRVRYPFELARTCNSRGGTVVNQLTRKHPLGTRVRLLEGVGKHASGATGVTEGWSGTNCVRVLWDSGIKDTYGWYMDRFEVMGGPW